MARARLDENRPYGSTYGSAGHAFEQDGRYFGADKAQIGRSPQDAAAGPLSEPVSASGLYADWSVALMRNEIRTRTAESPALSMERSDLVAVLEELDDLDAEKIFAEPEPEEQADARQSKARPYEDLDISGLRALHKQRAGKAPHHAAKAETIITKLREMDRRRAGAPDPAPAPVPAVLPAPAQESRPEPETAATDFS